MTDLDVSSPDAAGLVGDLRRAAGMLGDLEPVYARLGRTVVAAASPPRATGRLAGSLVADVDASSVGFGADVDYWTFVEFGAPAIGRRGVGFYRSAIDAAADDAADAVAEHLADVVERIT